MFLAVYFPVCWEIFLMIGMSGFLGPDPVIMDLIGSSSSVHGAS